MPNLAIELQRFRFGVDRYKMQLEQQKIDKSIDDSTDALHSQAKLIFLISLLRQNMHFVHEMHAKHP